MKKPSVYLGKHPEGSSMALVANQIASFVDAKICSNATDLAGSSHVINVVPDRLTELLKARRFAGYDSLWQFFAPNFEEYDDADLSPLIVALATGKLDGLIVHSQWSLSKLKQAMATLYSPSTRVEVLKKTKLVLWGVSDEFQYSTEGRQATRWVAPFNRINGTQKNIAAHHEVMARMKAVVPDFDCLFIFSGMTSRAEHDLSAYTIEEQGDRARYLQLIADRGAFLCTSNYESFGIYYLELLKSGLVGVFLDRPWINMLLPDYPLMVPASELPAVCLAVSKDLPHFQALVREYVDAHFSKFHFDRVAADMRAALSL